MKSIKKFLAFVVATTMVMGSSVIALADDGTVGESQVVNTKGSYSVTTTTESTFTEPIVYVVVPTQTPVVLNPYKIETKLLKSVYTAMAQDVTSSDPFVCGVYNITSKSNVPVKIVPTFTTTATGASLLTWKNAKGSAATTAQTTKWVEVRAKFVAGSTTAYMDLGNKASGIYSDDEMKTATDIIMDAAETVTKDTNGNVSAETPTVATVTFEGTLNSAANVATSWDTTDKLKIVTKWVIQPQVQE